MSTQTTRLRITVNGTVQGVGFRPFVYNLARTCGLAGTVCNTGKGVEIEVEGPPEAVRRFTGELQARPPALARITGLQCREMPPLGDREFIILQSHGQAAGQVLVPPDVATCADCRREMLDPADRHFRYPFTNCTNCGPRFTIVRDLPYDRPRTAMASFPMCPECAREYHDPADRRFHAQPVACPACGPQVTLVDAAGRSPDGLSGPAGVDSRDHDVITAAQQLLQAGYILAVKGLGGFHLACDARNAAAVDALRRRKHRPCRPLAVMCRDMSVVEEYCLVAPEERELLLSPAAPIVVLARKPGCPLPAVLAPGLQTLGVMLPYTPLHYLLFAGGPPALVMTSGNRSGLPLAIDNERALSELDGIADYFLLHNREIVNRCDDSVTMVVGGETQFLRRSRGYVPRPLAVPVPAGAPVVLGMGGEMKNTCCLLKAGEAYLSQHVGRVDTLEGQANLAGSRAALARLIRAEPAVVAYDLHPGYHSSRLAREMAVPVKTGVQHHHAHLAACMAENGLTAECAGLILDGTGYGPDGTIRGFEVLRGDYRRFAREYYLAPVPLPGGDGAVRNPWISAVAYLYTFLGRDGLDAARERFAHRGKELALVETMLRAGLNTPPASSCGRIFDAVSAMLGICEQSTYEAQAAIELGDLVPRFPAGRREAAEFPLDLQPYPCSFRGAVIDPAPVLAGVWREIKEGVPASRIARRFHDWVAAVVIAAALRLREKYGINNVCLSGGTWHNRYLSGVVPRLLAQKGFAVYSHHLVPAGDGGLSLGQAVAGCYRVSDGN
ncbi:carbamoyltransferase HypF [Desulfotomaculum copahuensis]|uniref:Carbamoyltransferase n=1 Tax=Desulfotomaculum copahuensis TaxID=1838280 RepID=A0A1B7LHI6_9FIRM|nr:carbamoyltransferase HypF [Desulfotomaculum copahuensis]OAT85577.1 carbamoyltransferase HypF [Desulfotomaculum copahuensis]